MATYIINADSLPDYDSWGPDDYWSCVDWIDWHKALKVAIGKVEADKKWLSYWNDQDSFEHDFNWCKYNTNFNNYIKSENLPVSHLLADLINAGTSVGENVIGAATTTTKVLKYIVPAVVIIVVLGLVIYFSKRYKLFA